MRALPSSFVVRLAVLALAAAVPAQGGDAPRVAVVVTIDQFRADYLERFRPWFGEGGFLRLLEGGAVYENCHYRHAVTKTAPGHATILSGVHAEIHGIVGNEWLDRSTWQVMTSVQDVDTPLVGMPEDYVLAHRDGRSPKNFRAVTVGDQAKLRLGTAARVFSIANKDRSAILLGGTCADGVYWQEDGRMITSRYYQDALPDWVEAFNAEKKVEAFHGEKWTRLVETSAYEKTQGADDAPGETDAAGLGRVFPHVVDGGEPQPAKAFYDAFDVTPFSSDLLGDFAEQLIISERVGQGDGLDLLCIGFSQIDRVGHDFGPDSHEVMDSVVRLDRRIAALFAALDRAAGQGRWSVVLTADHGVCPLPERMQIAGSSIPAARLDVRGLDAAVTDALDRAFGTLPERMVWCRRDNFGYHFFPPALDAKGLGVAQAAAVAKHGIEAWPQIAHAFTSDEILAMASSGDSRTSMMRRSFFPDRSQDVIFVVQPYVVDWNKPAGTTHGTPYAYDTHVPLLWYGHGIVAGTHIERVGVDDLAPTLAALLGVPCPPQANGRQLF